MDDQADATAYTKGKLMLKAAGSHSTRPALAPIDVDQGSLDLADAARLGALVLGSFSVSTIGAFITWSVVTTYYEMASWRFILALFGFVLSVSGFGFGVLISYLMIDRWLTHKRWSQQWQDKQLASWEANGHET